MQDRATSITLEWETPRLKGVTALAKKIGISKCHLSSILHGRVKPGAKVARALARRGYTRTVDGSPIGKGGAK